MRTTLTLDEDVAFKLKTEVRKSGKPFKEVVNETLREGLFARQRMEKVMKELPPFKVKARSLGLYPHLSYDCTGKLLEEVEGPFYK